MLSKKSTKIQRFRGVFAGFLVFVGMLAGVGQTILSSTVYAEPTNNAATTTTTTTDDNNNDNDGNNDNNNNTDNNTTTNTGETNSTSTKANNCTLSMGSLGWIVCPLMNKISEAIDWLYDKIEGILVISPVEAKDGTPVYEIWKYCLTITNIVFIIFLLVVIYSQITGWGINNYGIKKVLPKLILTAVVVNLSFLICSLMVDVSNVVGNGLRGLFETVEQTALANTEVAGAGVGTVSMVSVVASMVGGTALTIGAGVIAFELGMFWMLIPVLLGGIVAVVTGLVTIALRQAVVILLVMISPLAFVAGILPNTEGLFQKWKGLFTRMLVFYPLFSLLFGASSLAGFAIIMSAKDGFALLLGLAVQIFPLFFSWKLMRMSGTILGDINTKLRSIADRPVASSREFARSRQQQTKMNTLIAGKLPSAHLMRFMDNRRALREKHTENLKTIRKNEANMYVQRMMSGGYDGSKTQGNSGYLKANKYARAMKDASTSGVLSETATMDTAHVISNYGKYFPSKKVRDGIKEAELVGDKASARRMKLKDVDFQRDDKSGKAFLEYSRAQMTKENDEEADFGFMVGQFLDASVNYDPNAPDTEENRERMEKYRHYIVSSAGGLGETGQTRVLGKIIARAAAVESNQRRDIGIVAAKFPPDKRNFRNFLFNYYIDDDGYATDKDGNRIETMRDYLRVNSPEKLVMWDKFDENGPYYDWYDVNGKYVTRIYKKDKSAIKELMSNFDTPINDPINNMLAIHAGIKEQPNSEIPVLRHMGLDAFRTTVGRALMAAPFKEKNAAFSPMVAEMVKKGYIKNYAQEYLAYLDSLNKATKPGAWNMQDGDAIDMFTLVMDPSNWEVVFPTELIKGYLNVNGEPIYGIRYDENGNRVKVPAEEATREELMERIKEKFIVPAAKKMTVMMSRQTQNTMDNQKAGTVEKWKKLKEVFDTKWGDGGMITDDPYEQNGDMRQITKEIRDTLYTVDENGNRRTFTNRGRGGEAHGGRMHHVNHAAQIFELYNHALDADEFARDASEYCVGYKETAWIADQIQDFVVQEGYGVTKEQLYEYIEELLAYVDYD
ncbi:hypothetical protein IKG60_01670 [Candidatus Saccharibacteria bacterium]|nr:hypothetical protein [Candidatus Saccharibacteria bacterium]